MFAEGPAIMQITRNIQKSFNTEKVNCERRFNQKLAKEHTFIYACYMYISAVFIVADHSLYQKRDT